MMKQLKTALSSLVILGAILACNSQQTSPGPTVTTPPSQSIGRLGIAGLIPRNYPNPTEADWQDLYSHLADTGNLLGVYTAWTDSPQTEGQPPKVLQTAFDLQKRSGITPVIALSFFRDTVDGKLESNLDFQNADQRARAVQAAAQTAKRYQPPYLALGVEVNRFYTQDPAGFGSYVDLYKEMYAAAKAASPQTKVFPIFQYELMRGGVYFAGDKQSRPQWDLLQDFDSHLDLLAFTTYPFLLYGSPDDLPSNYYTSIAEHTNLAFGFTEIGWPSAPLPTQPDSAFGGTPEEQSKFVSRFFELNQGDSLEFALWSFPYDVGNGFNPAFTNISLRTNDGQAKPALAVWEKFAHGGH